MVFFRGLRRKRVAKLVAAMFVLGLAVSGLMPPAEALGTPGLSGAVAVHIHSGGPDGDGADTRTVAHVHVNKCCSTPCQETAGMPPVEACFDLVSADRWVVSETLPVAHPFCPPDRPSQTVV